MAAAARPPPLRSLGREPDDGNACAQVRKSSSIALVLAVLERLPFAP